MRIIIHLLVMGILFYIAVPVMAQEEKFDNDHYAVVVGKSSGGLISSLRAKPSGEELINGMRIYTDYGIYNARGYVGTSDKSAKKFEARREGGVLLTVAEGELLGKSAEGRLPIGYRVQMRFDSSPLIHILAAVRPGMSKEETRGFMALCWSVPVMAKWRLRTVEGLLRHIFHPGEGKAGRSYSHQWPLDPVQPLIAITSGKGVELEIINLHWSGVPPFTGPVIHNQTVFLCWLDGSPRKLEAGKWATLEFDLKVTKTVTHPDSQSRGRSNN